MFKVCYLLALVIVATSCSQHNDVAKEAPLQPKADAKLQSLLDANDVAGTIAVFDSTTHTLRTSSVAGLDNGFLPASTFKIVNSIIGLETGVITADHIFRWDSVPRAMPAWEHDLTLTEAFNASCVPCYQELARSIGTEKMQRWVDAFHYGDMVISDSTLDMFWLEGASTITPMQQLDFLRRFHDKKLPITNATYETMMQVMTVASSGDSVIRGKTGWAVRDDSDIGWFVGWLQSPRNVRYTIVCITPKPGFDMTRWTAVRRQLAELSLAD